MGEWSEYFEDFPEEDQANWINGRFDPIGAKEIYAQQAKLTAKINTDQANLNKTISKMIVDGKTKGAAKKHGVD